MDSDAIKFRPSKLLLIGWALPSFLVAVLMGVGLGSAAHLISPEGSWQYWFGFLVWLLIFLAGLSVAAWHFYSIAYELDDRRLTVCQGIIWKICRTTPLDKITNLDVRQGPISRLLKLGDIWIQTASTGSTQPEVVLTGLGNVNHVRQAILDRSDIARRTPLSGAPSSEKPLSAGETSDTLATLGQISETLKRIEQKLDRKG